MAVRVGPWMLQRTDVCSMLRANHILTWNEISDVAKNI